MVDLWEFVFLLGLLLAAGYALRALYRRFRERHQRSKTIRERQEELDRIESGDDEAISAFVRRWRARPEGFFLGLDHELLKVRFEKLWLQVVQAYDYEVYCAAVRKAYRALPDGQDVGEERRALIAFFKKLAEHFQDGFWERFTQESEINLPTLVERLNQLLKWRAAEMLGSVSELNEIRVRSYADYQASRPRLLRTDAAAKWGITLQNWPEGWNELVDRLVLRPEDSLYALPEPLDENQFWYNFDAMLYQALGRGDAPLVKRMKALAESYDHWHDDVDALLRHEAEVLIAQAFPIPTS